MTHEPIECPRCGEIALVEYNGEYTCWNCGHYEMDLNTVKEWTKEIEDGEVSGSKKGNA